ncbi:MAG: hypothetical protein Q4P07_08435 [Ornithinimicrobium sp.]|uniref:hypothetical protein n=1 Tax=Ornithinimicrobium sp. TaxID=1977084 RepID=UPI0026E102A6|nr:hypothetical protein [Ornithinimicrobium sp.]MDO5740160.1 hypothetical protein [Ornithinimicrobium sp.]
MNDRDRQDGPQPPPMLILGRDQPDVEDTTPEQVRRQQEQAQREIEQQQLLAKEEIERDRARTERELNRQQAEIDRAQRELDKHERHLRKKMSQQGLAQAGVPLVRVSTPPRVRSTFGNSTMARVLTGAAVVSVLVTGVLAGQVDGDPEAVASFVAADEERAAWQQIGLQLDEDTSAHLAGQKVDLIDGVPATLALVDAAATAYPLQNSYYADSLRDGVTLVLQDGVNPVNALTTWTSLRDGTDYAVSRRDVERLRDTALATSPLAPIAGTIALGALLLLLILAWRARAWSSLALVVAAAACGIALVAQLGASTPVKVAAQAHQSALSAAGDATDLIQRDLETAYRLRNSYRSDTGYWTDAQRLEDLGESSGRTAYVQARTELGEAIDTPQVYAAGVAVSRAGQVVMDERAATVAAARADVVSSLDRASLSPLSLALGALSALLAASALAVDTVRRRREKDTA